MDLVVAEHSGYTSATLEQELRPLPNVCELAGPNVTSRILFALWILDELIGDAIACGNLYRDALVGEMEADGWTEAGSSRIINRVVNKLIPAGTDPRGD